MTIRGLGPSPEKVTLRNAINRLLADGYATPQDWLDRLAAAGAPPLNMYAADGELVVKAHLPGVAPEDLHIATRGNRLTIAGETREDVQREAGDQALHGQLYGAFERTVPLPCAVKAELAVAEFGDGILTVTLPMCD
jgi:HSP20 family protein